MDVDCVLVDGCGGGGGCGIVGLWNAVSTCSLLGNLLALRAEM